MRRGAKPPKAKAKLAVARKSPENEGSRVRDLEKRLAEALDQLQTRDRELAEAREQRTATSEILRVIASSPTDEQPVFETIVASALRLLNGHSAGLRMLHGNELHSGAFTSTTPSGDSALAQGPIAVILVSSSAHFTRVVKDRTPSLVEDTETDSGLPPGYRQVARARGYRSGLAVPLLRGETVLGLINVTRRAPGPFSADDIALLQTFADQAVIAIENVRLFNETKEALDRQTATSEILRVISSSPTDVNPVFRTILANANRLCDASFSVLWLWDGESPTAVAHENVSPAMAEALRTARPLPNRRNPLGLSILEQTVVHVADVLADPRFTPGDVPTYRLEGARSIVAVPMVREGALVGVINAWRREQRSFSDGQIALLRTFADQAVIAIENVRLFTELQEKHRALAEAHKQATEALEQQTATSEILRVISRSPTDVQPVFDSLVTSAARLCGANDVLLLIRESTVLRPAAGVGLFLQSLPPDFRVPLVRGTVAARSVIDGETLHFPDLSTLSDAEFPVGRDLQRRFGHRTVLAVPLMREGIALGTIFAMRFEVRPFGDQQVALLKTFADQAVIAIENVRLFTELQASNRELTTALDTQTATSDILRVISRAQTDVQPVFDAIVESAVRLLRGYTGALSRVAGDQIELAALTSIDDANDAATRAIFPQPLQSEWPHALVIRNGAALNIADLPTDPAWPETWRANARVRGFRSLVVVPLLRHDKAIGAIAVTRREPGGFADDEIALLKTFGDQAVIAIENVRLFKELEARTTALTRSVEQLTALGEVGRAVSSTLDLETVLTTIVSRAVQLSGLDAGVVFEYDADAEEFVQRAATETGGALAEARLTTRIRKGEGALGRTAITLEPVQVPDITLPGAHESRLREMLIESGVRAVLVIPMVREGELIGCLGVTRNSPGGFPAEIIDLLRTFATQSALAIQNARLFHEIENKSRQLEAVSQHKSEFLANMSHELRTPLNAIIGFSEVLSERMFGELNEKQEEYLKDIHASGQHLLSLINDILDLSKIEAGRMELELTDFDLPTAIDNAVTLVRERAGRRGIALHQAADEGLGQIRGDERKIKQVLLNLLSNAIKFTPDGGRIDVRAKAVDGSAEVSVSDTGVGIAPEDQEAIFEEFRQVGTADKKVEGTGLGLALSRKFIELHGGRIWVQSELGAGSTFTFTIPIRPGA